MNPAYLWAFLGAAAAVLCEVFFRTRPSSGPYPPYAVVSSLIVNYCVYRILKCNTIISGMVIWTLATSSTRMLATLWLGEAVTSWQWVAFFLVMVAGWLRSQ